MSGFEIVEAFDIGSYETIAEIEGMYKIEKFSGHIGKHFVEIGKTDRSGDVDYSVKVDDKWVANGVSQSEAQAALRRAVG